MSDAKGKNLLTASGNVRRSSFVWNLLSAAMNSFQTMLLLVFITRFGTETDSASFVMAYAGGNLLYNIGKYGVRQFQVTDSTGQYSFRDYAGARVISLAGMAVAVAAYVLSGVLFRGYTATKALVVLLICLYKGIEAAEDVFHGRMQQQGRLDVAGRILFIRIFSFAVCYAAIFMLTRDILLTTAAATLLAAVLAVALNRSVWGLFAEEKASSSRMKQLLRACAPLCLSMLLNMYLGNAPKYIIDGRVSDALQTRFNIIFMPVFAMALIGTFIYQPELKSLGEMRGEKQFDRLKKKALRLTALTAGLTFAAAGGGWLLGIPVLEFIYAAPLAELKTELVLFILCGGMIALTNLYGMILIAFRRQGALTGVCILSALVLFLFGRLALVSGGVSGLAVFFAAVFAVHTLLLALFVFRTLKQAAREDDQAHGSMHFTPGAVSGIEGKKILFVSTKNLDYLRNTQEIRILKACAKEVNVVAFPDKGYAKRLIKVWGSLARTKIRDWDMSFIGFAPQLTLPFFRKLREKPVAEDFFISLYDTFVQDRKKFREGSLLAKALKKLDEKTLRLGDTVIADTRAHAEYFVQELGCDPAKIEVLYLEADEEIYYPMKAAKEPGEPFRVLYFGSVLPLQGVDVVLDAVRLLKDEKGIAFEVIGPVPEDRKPAQENLTCIPWLSQEALARHIARADLCLAGHFSAEIDKAKRTIPGKAYIYRAMEKAMILGDTPANHELFEEDERTVFTPLGDVKTLAEKIREFILRYSG